jgi:hypothetical protein
MNGTELKTDSSHRWMMYPLDAYRGGSIFLSAEQRQAIEEGKKYAQHAYADVWAKNTELVARVRSFLATHFHWHQRLAKNGGDLDVILTLQSMIRGESVVLIAERAGRWRKFKPGARIRALAHVSRVLDDKAWHVIQRRNSLYRAVQRYGRKDQCEIRRIHGCGVAAERVQGRFRAHHHPRACGR